MTHDGEQRPVTIGYLSDSADQKCDYISINRIAGFFRGVIKPVYL